MLFSLKGSRHQECCSHPGFRTCVFFWMGDLPKRKEYIYIYRFVLGSKVLRAWSGVLSSSVLKVDSWLVVWWISKPQSTNKQKYIFLTCCYENMIFKEWQGCRFFRRNRKQVLQIPQCRLISIAQITFYKACSNLT